MTLEPIIHYLETHYPESTAVPSDIGKIGLAVGSLKEPLKKILLALDVTSEVVDEAIALGANLIITHHPFLYQPVSHLLFDEPKTQMIEKLLVNRISCYSLHTNFDLAPNGINDTIAIHCGLSQIEGEEGSFLRMGMIQTMQLKEYAQQVKKGLSLTGVRYIGADDQLIRKVGIIGGSGGDLTYLQEAIIKKCDCLVTGEVKFHVALAAKAHSFALIEVSHGVESLAMSSLLNDLNANFSLKNQIFVTKTEQDPFKSI